MYDLSLAEICQLRNSLEIELIPIAYLVLNILKNIIRDLIFGDSNKIVFALEIPSLADPNRIAFLAQNIDYILEVFHPHFFVGRFLEAGLIGIDEGFC